MARPAAFLDRDGTIIHDADYIASPSQVVLLPDVAPTIRQLNDAGMLVIVTTNQSGIARGYFTFDDYRRVQHRLETLLADDGAHIDATYYCPHHPDFTGTCDCRKPGIGMFRQAATEHDVDLTRSLYAGDRWRDVAPARVLGGRGILIPGQVTPPGDLANARAYAETAASLAEAVDRWLSSPEGPWGSVPSAHPSS